MHWALRVCCLLLLLLLGPATWAEAPESGGSGEPAESGSWRMQPSDPTRGTFSRVSGPKTDSPAAPDPADPDPVPGPARIADDPAAKQSAGEAGEEAEEEAEPRGATYGKACVVGARGQVLYAPPGKDCGGSAVEQRRTPASPMRPGGPSDSHCIYGPNGRVIHRPEGSRCGS